MQSYKSVASIIARLNSTIASFRPISRNRCGNRAGSGSNPTHSIDPDSERRFVTILRADVVDSTGLVAELEPEAAVSRLEPALAAMRGAVRQFGGIVSKELGDGLAAVFGAPIADDNHAPLACHAAIELVRRVGSLGDPDSTQTSELPKSS